MNRVLPLAGIVLGAFFSGRVIAATVVNVTPSNMNGWAFHSFDNNFNEVTSGPYAGTAGMVTGPGTPPLGTGSAHLATNPGFGDGGEVLNTDNFDGALLSSLTALSYSAYMHSNGPVNNQQMPYLLLAISTDGNAIASNGSNLDFMEFEPPYQQTSTGNPSLPDQNDPGAGNRLPLDTWQSWDALHGGWYDGTIGGNGGTDVVGFSAFLAAYPNATIADPSGVDPGFAGINLQIGFADATSVFDGNFDAFSIGDAVTTYNFDPDAPVGVPLPASAWSGLVLIGLLATVRVRRRMQAA